MHAVDGVSFEIGQGEVLGLVGESGSGKTTIGRLLTRLENPTGGSIRFKGREIATLGQAALRPVRKELQIIFQDPYDSLDPRYTVERLVAEPLAAQERVSAAARQQRVREALEMVELVPPNMFLPRYPHELSGGQRQRVAIARAMVVHPSVVVADEPVSMLDVSIRAGVLALVQRLNRQTGVSYLFITHDLAVARYMSHRIAVMYIGKIVEIGSREEVTQRSLHPYTRMLIAAVPDPDPRTKRVAQASQGEAASAISPPPGCRFHPRCPIAEERCQVDEPQLRIIEGKHRSACHLAERFIAPTPA